MNMKQHTCVTMPLGVVIKIDNYGKWFIWQVLLDLSEGHGEKNVNFCPFCGLKLP